MRALAAALALSLSAAPLRANEPKPAEAIGRIVGSGKPVYLNDRLTTGASGRLQIRLKDDTLFTIGPNSSIVIDEFIYDPSSSLGRVAASILQGVFQFVTGKVGKKRPENMKVTLPACTIGVNGTAVMGRVEPGRDTVVLSTGAIAVGNGAGQARLAQAGYAVTVDAGRAPSAPFRAPLPLLASLMKALAPDKRSEKAGAGPAATDGRQGCSRALEPPSPKARLFFKNCVARKAGQAGLEPENLVYFDEIVDVLEKFDDAALAEALKKAWLTQLEKVSALYPDQAPPAPVAQWMTRQETPIKAFVRPAAGPQARADKDAVAVRYGLAPAALARLEELFE